MIEFAVRGNGEFLKARMGVCPPFLRHGIGVHFGHVGVVICANIFKIGEYQVAVKEDGIVLQIALGDGLENIRPYIGVELAVLFDFVFFQPAQLTETNGRHGKPSLHTLHNKRQNSTMSLVQNRQCVNVSGRIFQK